MLPNSLHWLVFSPGVRIILEREGIRGIQFLPIRVRQSGKEATLEGWPVANVLDRVAALDLNQSECDVVTVRGASVVVGVRRYVLRGQALHGCDIFRLAELRTDIVVSERVMHLLQAADIQGIDFYEVHVSEG